MKMFRRKNNRNGFTLMEIIIVIAIIAILAVIAIPTVTGYVEEAKQIADLQMASNIITAAQIAMASPGSGIPPNTLVEILWNTGPETQPANRRGTILMRYPDTGGRVSVLKGTVNSLKPTDQSPAQKEHFNTLLLEPFNVDVVPYTDFGASGYFGMLGEAKSKAGQSTSFVIHLNSTTGEVALASHGTAADSNIWIDEIGVGDYILRAP